MKKRKEKKNTVLKIKKSSKDKNIYDNTLNIHKSPISGIDNNINYIRRNHFKLD